ncbi:hypothetical protein ACWDTG_25900 [Rhodococcus zopfii]
MTKPYSPDSGAYDQHVEHRRLTGKEQLWLDRCRAVVTERSGLDELLADLEEATPVYEALYDGSNMHWARAQDVFDEFDIDEDIPTPELATARTLAALTQALAGSDPADGVVEQVLRHFDFSGVRSVGTQLLAAGTETTAGSGPVPTLVREMLGSTDHPSRGFAILLLLEMAGRRPSTSRHTQVPVLFQATDDTGSHGETGKLTITVLDEGPSGLHPDPALMAFLQADEQLCNGLDAAWAASSLADTDTCAVWSVVDAENNPCNKIEGESMSAAFAVALDDVAPKSRLQRLRRLRTLDRNCAVTAGLEGTTLTRVEGYDVKTLVARRHSYRVVVAKSALESARAAAPADFVISIRGAETIDEAIAETRTVVNKPLYATAAALILVLALAGVGGIFGYSKYTQAQRERVSTQLASEALGLANSNSRLSALLALTADHLHSSETTRATMRTVTENNQSIAASATAADAAVDRVATYGNIALTSSSEGTLLRGWTLPDLTPLGEITLDHPVRGMGGAGHSDTGMIALLTGPELKVFQGMDGMMPAQAASFATPFTDPNVKTFGPFVDSQTNTIVAFDENFQGIYWTPGMSRPDTFTVANDVSPRSKLVAVSGFGPNPDLTSEAKLQSDTFGRTVLLGTADRTVYRLEVTGAAAATELSTVGDRSPSASSPSGRLRAYRAGAVVRVSGLDSDIYALGISNTGSILVGLDTGLRQFRWSYHNDNIDADVDSVIKDRVTAITRMGTFSDNFMIVTSKGMTYLDRGRATQLTNADDYSEVKRSIKSMTGNHDGTVLAGRVDGGIVLVDPSSYLTRLTDRFGATDIEFTSDNELIRAAVTMRESNYFDSVSIGEVLEDINDRSLVQQGPDSVPETRYRLGDSSSVQMFSVDATADRVAATGIDRSTGRSHVWVWDRGPDDDSGNNVARTLDFQDLHPDITTVDVGRAVALSPDGDRVYGFNPGRGQVVAWSAEDGQVLWTTTYDFADQDRAVLAASMTFDARRERGLIDYFNADGILVHSLIDLSDGSTVQLDSLADYQDTYLSPAGDKIVASIANDAAIFRVPTGGTDPHDDVLVGRTNLGSLVGRIAWSPDQERLAVDLFGTGQIVFLSTRNLEEDAPRWRMQGFDDNDHVTDLSWSPDSGFLAVNVGTSIRDNYFQTRDVRVLLTDDLGLDTALCNITSSELTESEWQKYVGNGIDQFPVCRSEG